MYLDSRHFVLLLSLLCRCQTFILRRNIGNISSEDAFFITRWLLNAHDFTVISDPLLDDIDLDGELDLYFTTVDGTLYGITGVLKCVTGTLCTTHHENWPASHSNETFFSAPSA
ncbi:unnamed protein product, partial [Heterobilharzia americana]